MVRRGMAAALCAAALVVSGCSDDPPEPKPLDPPTGSESTTAPPTSEPPETQTPEQLIRDWIRTSYEVQISGETDDFRELGRDCSPCDKFARRVEKIYTDGGWIKPPRQRVAAVKFETKYQDGRQIYQASTRSPRWSLKESKAASVSKQPGGPATYRFELKRFADQWRVTDYTIVVDAEDVA
jgi:hypothetical protein